MNTILLVEDDPDDALFLRRAATKAGHGYAIHVARDGIEAQEYLTGTGVYADRTTYPLPEYILLDIKMPRRTGLEVLAWMQEHPALRAIPVVVLTSSREPGDIQRALGLGIRAYCIKPVEFRRLLEVVEAVHRLIVEGHPLPDSVKRVHCLC